MAVVVAEGLSLSLCSSAMAVVATGMKNPIIDTEKKREKKWLLQEWPHTKMKAFSSLRDVLTQTEGIKINT